MNKTTRQLKKLGRRRRGATLVEFALIVPILLAILIGLMEFGWMAKNKLQLANAVREGARDAAVGIKTDTGTSPASDSIQGRIRNRATGLPGAPDKLVIDLKRDDGDNTSYAYTIPVGNKAADSNGKFYNDAPTGALIRVHVTLPHKSLTGIPSFGLLNGTLQTTVIMRRESGN